MPGRELTIRTEEEIYEEYHLTEQDRQFLELYLSSHCNHNGTLAMMLVMYGENLPDKEKRNVAGARAHRLLNRIEVKKALLELRKVKLLKYEDIAVMLLQQWQTASTFDPASLLDDEGRLLPLAEIPDEIRIMITDMKVNSETGEVDLKFQNKQKAQELLAKAIGMLSNENGDKNNNGDGDFANILAKIEDKEHVQ